MNSFVTMTKEVTENDEQCPLEKYKDKLLSLYTSELSDSNHQLRILAGKTICEDEEAAKVIYYPSGYY